MTPRAQLYFRPDIGIANEIVLYDDAGRSVFGVVALACPSSFRNIIGFDAPHLSISRTKRYF